jgi:hypothetical protein
MEGMKPRAHKSFSELEPTEIAAYARCAKAGIEIAPTYLAAVIENLHVLQGHARIVATALEAEGRRASDAAAQGGP